VHFEFYGRRILHANASRKRRAPRTPLTSRDTLRNFYKKSQVANPGIREGDGLRAWPLIATVSVVDRIRFPTNAHGRARAVRDMPPRRTPEDPHTEGPPYGATTKIAPRPKPHRHLLRLHVVDSSRRSPVF
jgi:hypothetical protein